MLSTLNRIVKEQTIFYDTKRQRDQAEARQNIRLAKYHEVQDKVLNFLSSRNTINKNIINKYCLPYKEKSVRSHFNIADWVVRSMIENKQLSRVSVGVYKLA